MNSFRIVLPLLMAIFVTACAAGNKIIEKRGNPMLRELPFTGMSGFCLDEKTAREEAMQGALAQVSLFDGVKVNYSYLSRMLETKGELQEKTVSELSLISQSIMRAISFDFYVEQRQGKTWQAWCHAEYSNEVRQKFLDELIMLTGKGSEAVESQLSASSPNSYIDQLEQLWNYYIGYQNTAAGWFTAPNAYTAFLQAKSSALRKQIEAFYQELVLSATSSGMNELSFTATYKNVPYFGMVSATENNTVTLIDTLVITKQASKADFDFSASTAYIISISPKRSGSTNLRVSIDTLRFAKLSCYRDFPVSLQLRHIFTGKTIALCSRDNQGERPETATAIAKLITEVEGRIIDLSAYTAEEALIQAKNKGCSYLFCAESSLNELRENPQQNLFIAFPALALKITDTATQQAVYQLGFPNPSFPDLRAFGKTRAAAISEAFSFTNVLSAPTFNKSFRELGLNHSALPEN